LNNSLIKLQIFLSAHQWLLEYVQVSEMTKLRAQARANNVYLRVVRNTLALRAIEGTDFACLAATFKGPIILAFSTEHPGAGPRLLKDFAKANDTFVVKGLAFEGEFPPAAGPAATATAAETSNFSSIALTSSTTSITDNSATAS
jgi:ribosomal protein L10